MKKGFTLAELMAVVVIIAIISSIGLGGYRRTVERAKLTEGLNMAHQIAQALARADWDRYNSCGTFDTPWDQLDIDSSGKNTMGKNSLDLEGRFTITLETTPAGTHIKAVRENGEDYTLEVPIDCGLSLAKLKDRCKGNTDFCISAGFSNCTNGTCTKP